MKFTLRELLVVIVIFTFVLISDYTYSQGPPPPPADHGTPGNQSSGGGAPIGSGLFILLGLGAAYGGKKLYDFRKEMLED